MLEILDSFIATITFVLILSLIIQSIQQIIKEGFNFKSKYMERELLAMLMNVKPVGGKWNFLIPQWLQHRLIKKASEAEAKILAVISSKLTAIGYNDLSLIERMHSYDFLKLLHEIETDASLTDEIRNALETMKNNIAHWYDHTLLAFQNHYERRMKMWAYFLSFALVLSLNADIFDIYKEFSANKVLRESAVKMGERLTSIPKEQLIVVQSDSTKDSLSHQVDSLALQTIERHIKKIDSLVNEQSFHIMRWNTANGDSIRWQEKSSISFSAMFGDFFSAAFRNFFGWAVMTFLVGLGAPFWYDILKTIIGIKNSFKKPEKTDDSQPVG